MESKLQQNWSGCFGQSRRAGAGAERDALSSTDALSPNVRIRSDREVDHVIDDILRKAREDVTRMQRAANILAPEYSLKHLDAMLECTSSPVP